MIVLLGDKFQNEQIANNKLDSLRIPRFTYRKKFFPLEGNYTSDRGWGCSIRCSQTLLAQFIQKSYILATKKYVNFIFSNIFKITKTSPNNLQPPKDQSNTRNESRSLILVSKSQKEQKNPPTNQPTLNFFSNAKKAQKKIVDYGGYLDYYHLFYDVPTSPFSIHSFCTVLKEINGIRPGKWVKLSTLSHAIKLLLSFSEIETVIAENGVVSIPSIRDAFSKYETLQNGQFPPQVPDPPPEENISLSNPDQTTKRSMTQIDYRAQPAEKEPPPPNNNLAFASSPQTDNNSSSSNSDQTDNHNSPPQQKSDSDDMSAQSNPSVSANNPNQADKLPVLILIPLMLGLKKLDDEFTPLIMKALSLPKQSIGIIGGKNNRAYYIVGHTDKGEFLYFDPHEVHDAVVKHQDLYRVFEPELRKIKKMQLSSSFMIGFMVKSMEDVDEIRQAMEGTLVIFSDKCMRKSNSTKSTLKAQDEESSDAVVDSDYNIEIVS